MSNQDYSRHIIGLSESVKSRPAAYYSEISSHFDLTSSQPSFETMQKTLLNFVHKRKKSDSISLKANPHPSSTKAQNVGNFFDEAKVVHEKPKQQSRSKSRPKFDEDQKFMQPIRTFNSLSTNKAFIEQNYSSQPSGLSKQGYERDSKRIIKYLLPKTKTKKPVNSYRFQREVNDTKPRKFFESKKAQAQNQHQKVSPLNKTNESKQSTNNFVPNLPRDGLISQSFVGIRQYDIFPYDYWN